MASEGDLHFVATIGDKDFMRSITEIRDAVVKTSRLLEQVAANTAKAGKEVEKAFDAQAAAVDTLTQKARDLAEEIDKAEKAGDTQKVAEKRKEHEKLSQELEEETQHLIELNAELGRKGMQAGGSDAQSFREKLRAVTNELKTLTLEYRSLSEAEQQSARGQEMLRKIEKLTDEAGNLRDVMGDVDRATRSVASDTRNWDALAGGINVATSAVGGLTGAAALLGAKEEDLQDIQTKLQASLAISNALSVIQNNLQKESALMLGIRNIQESALTAGVTLRAAAEGKGVIATMAATAAQKAFNLVANANPYVLLATAILSVGGALWAFSKGAKEAKRREEELALAAEEAAEKVKQTREAFVSASAEAMNNAGIISSLQVAYQKANTEFEKTGILKQAAEHFKKLGFECNGVTDAQRLLVQQGGAVIEMLRLQGEVAALTALRMEAYRRSYSSHLSNDKGVQYSSELANLDSEVQALDQQILAKSLRLSRIQSTLPMRRSGSITTRPGKSGSGTANTGKTVTEAERKAMRKKREREEAFAARELELSTAEATIKAKEEGTDKIIAQIWLDYNREMLAIEQSQEELRQKRIDAAKTAWDADPSNKDKDFYASDIYKTVSSTYTQEEIKNRAEREDAALMERERRLKEQADVEREAMNNYLKQYGDYQQQRLAITEEYDEKIRDAKTEGDRLMYAQQKREALRQVDERFGLVTQAMADLFADASKKSVKAIQGIIDKYEKLVEYMEGHKGSATKEGLERLGFSDADIQKILAGEISIKDLTDRLKELKGELKQKSPYQSFISNMKDAIDMLKKAETTAEKANAWGMIAQSINDALPSLKEFGAQIANIFGADDSKFQGVVDSLGGLSTAGGGIAQIFAGDIGGGIMNTVKGISQMVDALDGLFGADYSSYENLVEQYDRLIDVWDVLIDKKTEYISMSYGAEAMKATQEAIELLNKEADAWRNLGREWVNSGASAGSHSMGVRMRKRMGDADWQAVAASLGRSTDDYAGLGGRLEGLFDLTAEQLEKLRGDAPEFWAKLNDETQDYLNKIIEGAERLEDIQKQLKQQLTATTFDSVYDNFISSLSDMDKSAYDFSKDFEKYMFDAILSTKVAELFKKRIQQWYDNFAKANEDGVVSPEEMSALRAEWEALGREGMEMREELRKVTGYGSSSEGSATYNAVKSFTQEQGDVLNGRLTGIQMAVRENNVLATQIAASLREMASLAGTATDVSEIRNMMVLTNSYLDDMVRYAKATYNDFGTKITEIRDIVNTRL